MTTAADIITEAMHLFGILDETESPAAADVAKNVKVLNNLLRHEYQDGCASFLIKRVIATLPVGVSGSVYSFSIGTANANYLVQKDAVGVRAIWMNDLNLTVNRETRQAPVADVVRTTYPGIVTKWHQERQVDGSVLVTAWQPPRAAAQALIEYGERIGTLTAADGSDVVNLPPEGIHDATLLLGRRIFPSYGISAQAVGVIAQDAEMVDAKWRDWAKGQQWLRFVRA